MHEYAGEDTLRRHVSGAGTAAMLRPDERSACKTKSPVFANTGEDTQFACQQVYVLFFSKVCNNNARFAKTQPIHMV